MLTKLQTLARRLYPWRAIWLGTGILCMAGLAFVVLAPPSLEREKYLIPSIIGMLWGMSTYNAIVTFRDVAVRVERPTKFWGRVRVRILRVWHGLLALVSLGTLLAVVGFGSRLLFVWAKEYVL